MPLIQCPMCQKSISPNAVACPNCGEPMAKNNVVSSRESSYFPELPEDLSIGKQIVSWAFDAAVTGTYENCINASINIPNGKANVLLHQNGIKLCGKFYLPIMDIHSSQIVSIKELSKNELEDKSVELDVEDREMYENKFLDDRIANQWPSYGIGDPFMDIYLNAILSTPCVSIKEPEKPAPIICY